MEKAEKLLKRLPLLDIVELREQWYLHFNRDVEINMSSKLLRLAIGYRIQELEFEASDRCDAIRHLASLQSDQIEQKGYGYAQRMKPGTKLLREYRGKNHEVQAVDYGRFVYAGQVFKSLSAVARKITGTPRSGAVFF
eukprot:gene1989-2591_t